MTDLRQAAQQALDAWDDPMKDLTDLCVAMDDLRAALEQQAEPVAWMCCVPGQDAILFCFDEPSDERYPPKYKDPLYTHLPQRQWVGLTDEDFLEACQIAEHGNYLLALRRIQTKLKERNT